MAQPEFGGTDKGRAVMIFGSDGAKWIAALIDALGHFQVDVLTAPLPSDAATQVTLAAILAQLDVDLSTRAKESGGNLAAAVTALQKIDDLQRALISVGGDALNVQVSASVLPTLAAREIPVSPVSDEGVAVAVQNTTWTPIFSYEVTSGKTCYVTDLLCNCGEGASGTEFLWGLRVDGTFKVSFREGAARSGRVPLRTPLVATSLQDIDIQVYQWSGSAKLFTASFLGFEI